MSNRTEFEWNPRAHQPHNVMTRWNRNLNALRDLRHHLRLAATVARQAPAILHKYRADLTTQSRVNFVIPDLFAVASEPWPNRRSEILESFQNLQVHHTLVRIMPWLDDRELQALADFVGFLEQHNIDVTLALLQDRATVNDPTLWRTHLTRVFELFSDRQRYFEVGHAWNRKKWGVWHYREYCRLVRIALDLREHYSSVRFIGPAVLDFEYHFIVGALSELHSLQPFDRISSLLYVDRRGGPENPQYSFDLRAKIRLLHAISHHFWLDAPPIWITEFNWPLRIPGEYSPVAINKGFSEEQCANFLVRYYLLAISTGCCERILWWQLAAPGYGLIDNLDGRWRNRAAHQAMKQMIARLQNGTFISLDQNPDYYSFVFRDTSHRSWKVLWSAIPSVRVNLKEEAEILLDRDGKELPLNTTVSVGPSPLYVLLK